MIATACILVLGTVFVLGAAEKIDRLLRGTAAWHPVMLAMPLLRRHAAAWMLASAIADAGVVLVLAVDVTSGAAAGGLAVLGYTFVGLRALSRGDDGGSGCRCLAGLFEVTTPASLLLRNAALIACAAAGSRSVPLSALTPRTAAGAAVVAAVALLVLGIATRRPTVGVEDAPAATQEDDPAECCSSGPHVGRRLPDSVPNALTAGVQGRVIAFVDEGCAGCQELMAELAAASQGERDAVLVLGRNASPAFLVGASDAGIRAMSVGDRQWRECGVGATPLLVLVDGEGRVVDKGVSTHAAVLARRSGLASPDPRRQLLLASEPQLGAGGMRRGG